MAPVSKMRELMRAEKLQRKQQGRELQGREPQKQHQQGRELSFSSATPPCASSASSRGSGALGGSGYESDDEHEDFSSSSDRAVEKCLPAPPRARRPAPPPQSLPNNQQEKRQRKEQTDSLMPSEGGEVTGEEMVREEYLLVEEGGDGSDEAVEKGVGENKNGSSYHEGVGNEESNLSPSSDDDEEEQTAGFSVAQARDHLQKQTDSSSALPPDFFDEKLRGQGDGEREAELAFQRFKREVDAEISKQERRAARERGEEEAEDARGTAVGREEESLLTTSLINLIERVKAGRETIAQRHANYDNKEGRTEKPGENSITSSSSSDDEGSDAAKQLMIDKWNSKSVI